MNRILFTLSLLAFVSVAIAGDARLLCDPDNSGRWVLNKSVSDEFDGSSLDSSNWNKLGKNGNFYGQWKGRAPSEYSPANIRVEKGAILHVGLLDSTACKTTA